MIHYANNDDAASAVVPADDAVPVAAADVVMRSLMPLLHAAAAADYTLVSGVLQHDHDDDACFHTDEACGPYGHDIVFREICAAWRRPPAVTEMTAAEFAAWSAVEASVAAIKAAREEEEIARFRQGRRKPAAVGGGRSAKKRKMMKKQLPKLEALALTGAPIP